MSYKDKEKEKIHYNEYRKRPEVAEKIRIRQRRYYAEKRTFYRELANYYWKQKTPEYKKLQLENAKKLRIIQGKKVIQHYGGKCVCCKESNYEFLAINHIKGGGHKERESNVEAKRNIAKYIIKNNFPDRFNLLCHNCNNSLGFYNYCPHKGRFNSD